MLRLAFLTGDLWRIAGILSIPTLSLAENTLSFTPLASPNGYTSGPQHFQRSSFPLTLA